VVILRDRGSILQYMKRIEVDTRKEVFGNGRRRRRRRRRNEAMGAAFERNQTSSV